MLQAFTPNNKLETHEQMASLSEQPDSDSVFMSATLPTKLMIGLGIPDSCLTAILV
jgi:CRISPR/Cas system-associated endonuclease/helicase Cas3